MPPRRSDSKPLPYYDGNPKPEWNFAVMSAELVPEDHPFLIRLTGQCPRCEHETPFEYRLVTIAGVDTLDAPKPDSPGSKALGEALRQLDVELDVGEADIDIWCRCGKDHPGRARPADADGCGAAWVTHVEWS